ncbi:MAG: hypothetical protein HRU46_18770 [Verrucomicrobiales bacterium]|nr:hypothetical protein [Verrucomicrobiales bacterium]
MTISNFDSRLKGTFSVPSDRVALVKKLERELRERRRQKRSRAKSA